MCFCLSVIDMVPFFFFIFVQFATLESRLKNRNRNVRFPILLVGAGLWRMKCAAAQRGNGPLSAVRRISSYCAAWVCGYRRSIHSHMCSAHCTKCTLPNHTTCQLFYLSRLNWQQACNACSARDCTNCALHRIIYCL